MSHQRNSPSAQSTIAKTQIEFLQLILDEEIVGYGIAISPDKDIFSYRIEEEGLVLAFMLQLYKDIKVLLEMIQDYAPSESSLTFSMQ
ncbi:hypothetical protein CVT25_006911 [Psilocybe cyanescens]|uniref:Uncharacterized protein n=1 Tax=Psilocybe cyanescens TaxID=93625 RepID=A0A409X625_PSICY|nr:hypothetical protein CVT25_006911 [Psilocybe cyanescens]